MPGKYMRGALIHLMEAFLLPIPNVILFQYNPDQMTHSWTPPGGGAAGGGGGASSGAGARTGCGAGGGTGGNPLAASGFPGEAFSFTISVDANDTIADGSAVTAGIATVSGVYTRLAALEMLQYPVTRSNLGGLTGSVSVAAGGFTAGAFGGSAAGTQRTVPELVVPVVLFIWGAGRIVPVRVTGLTITEKLYDTILNPTHADAKLDLRVLTPNELNALPSVLKAIAKGAYVYTHALRQALAIANLANATESVVGLVS